MTCTLTIKEVCELKQEAEKNIVSAVSKILEDFKDKTGIKYIDYITIDSTYMESLGYEKETFISDATLKIYI